MMQISDIVGEMSDAEFIMLMENLLRSTKRQMEKEKSDNKLVDKTTKNYPNFFDDINRIQNENR